MTTGEEKDAEGDHASSATDDSSDHLVATLYARAAARERISRDELLTSVDASRDAVLLALDRLVELRLLRNRPGSADVFTTAAPATASAQLLLPAFREMCKRQAAIADVSTQLAALLPVYEGSVLGRTGRQPVDRIEDIGDVRSVLSELAARATREVLISQPGGPRPENVVEEARERTLRLLDRGVPMRTLYQYTAQFHQPTLDHVAAVVERGAEVRVTNDAFMRLIVIDREVALIELVDNDQGALIVREPSVVHFLARAFEQVWDTAPPFAFAHERGQVLQTSEEMKIAIVKLLVEGYDDKVVAKRLGISLRTFQRHLAEVLRRVGARNRLHAGYLIHEHGLLDGRPDMAPAQ